MNVKLLPHLNGQYDTHLEILSIQKKIGGGFTARKDPISATNHQWGMKKIPH